MKKEMGGCVTGSHKESKPGRTRTQREIGCDCSRICGWLPLIYTFRVLLATVFLYSSPYSAWLCIWLPTTDCLLFSSLCHQRPNKPISLSFRKSWREWQLVQLGSLGTLLPRVGPFRKRSALGGSIQDWNRREGLEVHCKMRMVVSEETRSMGNPSGNKHLIWMSPLFSD